MPIAALSIGLLIVAQGIVGLAVPDLFVGIVRTFQKPPVIYGAAVIRFVFGVVLFRAAPRSRAPVVLRGLGLLIALGGLLTPFLGISFARVVLGWWSDPVVVRVWAAAALVLGMVIVYSMLPDRRISRINR
jgi:hypothetical protein